MCTVPPLRARKRNLSSSAVASCFYFIAASELLLRLGSNLSCRGVKIALRIFHTPSAHRRASVVCDASEPETLHT